MANTALQRPSGLDTAPLLTSLAELLRAWLPRQRWFAGKGRPVTDLTLLSTTELYPGCLHLLVRTEHLGPPAHAGTATPVAEDCYQLLLGVREVLPPRLAHAFIGRASAGPLADLTVYDAFHDPKAAGLLLERLRRSGNAGPLRFERDPRFTVPPGLTPRLLDAEQSNSSLVYGDAFILKVFRRVQPGINPDLEVPRALARQGCTRVPAPAAWFHTSEPQEATLGVLQPYLRDAADGWTLALESLGSRKDFTGEAYELGRATAEVHLALATAFPLDSPSPYRNKALADAMHERLDAAVRSVPELRPHAAGLRSAFDALAALDSALRPAQRIHGDLHLGQVLRAGQRWSVIDFEGEPARPISERRRVQSPVRDVAGMLRSFDYAARSRQPWRPEWAERCREAFCAGYAVAADWDPREEPELLRAYETDRAVYEVLYEARHRPDWLPVPMAAVGRLADHP
ncbi:maltokinase N-terminal cap-like domain-containing protein [Streptomyces rhizosphaerihabitans]|uniref:maltokinase N-terminal cap-like domain-containing protein n=1 Tax=Streptomyces rhizosphaerihabitans TaxID=1266770 RepID=UPI0021BF901A|nr:phosphotransferase [Streptomyces rhizosphaerihabitans]MCT9011835.1 phosphotransferase [Streptomyces rhizosphaerihabitans]